MTKSEFDEWLSFHFSRFTGASSWLGKFPVKSRFVGDPTQVSVMESWYSTLKTCELKHAKEATQLLAIGEEEFSERGYDCHPRCVRAVAVKLSGNARAEAKREIRFVGGEPVYDCGPCRDSGFVVIWHPTALKFFKDELANSPPMRIEKGKHGEPDQEIEDWGLWYFDNRWRELRKRGQAYDRCVVLCKCELGQMKKLKTATYDDRVHVLFGNGDPREAMNDYAQTPAGGYGLDSEF